jgi:hypothetical protein
MTTKICNICTQEKDINLFSKHKLMADGYLNKCKECESALKKEYHKKNKDKILQRVKDWAKNNPDKACQNKKKHYLENKQKLLERSKIRYENNREKILEYTRNRYKTLDRTEENKKQRERNAKKRMYDINFKIQEGLRARFYRAVSNSIKSGSAVADLECSIEEFKQYISKQFEPGMSWENWGHSTWHLDHIIPLAYFDLTDREQLLKACHYTNYRPMWAMDNMKKSSKISEEYGNNVDLSSLPISKLNRISTRLQQELTKENLVDMIVYKRMKVPQICEQLSVSEGSVMRYMKMFGLTSKWHEYYNTVKLKELCDIGLSSKQIGSLLGLSRASTKSLLRKKKLSTNLKSIKDIIEVPKEKINLENLIIVP